MVPGRVSGSRLSNVESGEWVGHGLELGQGNELLTIEKWDSGDPRPAVALPLSKLLPAVMLVDREGVSGAPIPLTV